MLSCCLLAAILHGEGFVVSMSSAFILSIYFRIYLLTLRNFCLFEGFLLFNFKINVVCMHPIDGVRNSMEPPLPLLDAIPFNNISKHLKCNINPEIFLGTDG